MDVVEVKEIVRAEIDWITPTLLEVSRSIQANPELNFEEHHAHDTLASALEDQGLTVERTAYDMATAFESRAGSTTARRSPCCANTTRFRVSTAPAGTTSSASPVSVPGLPSPRSPGRSAVVSRSAARSRAPRKVSAR